MAAEGGRVGYVANEIARKLRKQMTPQEVKLWVHLRSWRKRGFHFRRQSPRSSFIVDFVCMRHRLVVEIDGGQHNLDAHSAADAERDATLIADRFRVLRFWNSDVDGNLSGVLQIIDSVLNKAQPHPAADEAPRTRVSTVTGGHPPPSGEG